ncbi:hypothetical protein [Zavarzinella formosa]|uniref:hypothetical protein n=1 Tax=Zavarzinella formosa TaxID=360055 RepID=UPI00030F98C9|nr:hypothetical protein [Zavarzinella formosa]
MTKTIGSEMERLEKLERQFIKAKEEYDYMRLEHERVLLMHAERDFGANAIAMMAVIRAQQNQLEVAREALLYVRHRDARWHDDDVVTPALDATNPNQELPA